MFLSVSYWRQHSRCAFTSAKDALPHLLAMLFLKQPSVASTFFATGHIAGSQPTSLPCRTSRSFSAKLVFQANVRHCLLCTFLLHAHKKSNTETRENLTQEAQDSHNIHKYSRCFKSHTAFIPFTEEKKPANKWFLVYTFYQDPSSASVGRAGWGSFISQ